MFKKRSFQKGFCCCTIINWYDGKKNPVPIVEGKEISHPSPSLKQEEASWNESMLKCKKRLALSEAWV